MRNEADFSAIRSGRCVVLSEFNTENAEKSRRVHRGLDKGRVDTGSGKMKVGILAVQGDFEAHGATLARIGVEHVFVRTPSDMDGVDAVILPGGESTTQWKFLVDEGLDKSLLAHAARGGAIFGTCAGAILLAREVQNPAQPSLELADITVIRNGYGRQLASEVRHETTSLSPVPIEMVFIRAPIIERMGPAVEVLAKSDAKPVLIRQGQILIATFHPELTSDTTIHDYFVRMAAGTNATSDGSAKDPSNSRSVPVERR
jgi:5'-phosphate synthase pdxT subunit